MRAPLDDVWFTDFADELARCLVDAETCAAACERVLDVAREASDLEVQQTAFETLVVPTAVARVLIELIDQPHRLVLAACRLFHDSAAAAAERLEALGARLDSTEAITALRAAVVSCRRLLEATG